MARLRPTEVRAIAQLLDDPAEDVEELAAKVITTLDDMRAKRTTYVVVIRDPGTGYSVWGPWDTENQARKQIGTHIVASTEGAVGGVFPLHKERPDG